MSLNASPRSSSPPKRPRLSLQIKTPGVPQTLGKSVTALKGDVDPSSPTAFNTLSNAYAAAIENASPQTAKYKPLDTKLKPTSLRLETSNFGGKTGYIHPSQRTQTPGPFSITYPDTPLSAYPNRTPTGPPSGDNTKLPTTATATATAFAFTPPQSAGSEQPRIFTFAAQTPNKSPATPRTPRRRMTIGNSSLAAPYTHPRSLHSILRNSPLPPRTAATPVTPSRISMRLANRANKKVGYNDPLTQTITTNKYVKSHIDLLGEDSPFSSTPEQEVAPEKVQTLELAMTYTGDETRDGGQTPGPFEEMRRRMAESGLDTPGSRKRKRREKKRKWEWTINTTELDAEDDDRTPLTAVRKTPITAVRRGASVSEGSETEASEAEGRFVPDSDVEMSEMSEADEGSVQSEPMRMSTSLYK